MKMYFSNDEQWNADTDDFYFSTYSHPDLSIYHKQKLHQVWIPREDFTNFISSLNDAISAIDNYLGEPKPDNFGYVHMPKWKIDYHSSPYAEWKITPSTPDIEYSVMIDIDIEKKMIAVVFCWSFENPDVFHTDGRRLRFKTGVDYWRAVAKRFENVL